jgi:hypothetical protein
MVRAIGRELMPRNLRQDFMGWWKGEVPKLRMNEAFNQFVREFDIGVPVHQAFAECGMFEEMPEQFANIWSRISYDTSGEDMGDTDCNIVQKDKGGDFVRSVAESIKFPENTAYLHFLTCVASAMVRNFTFDVYGSKSPVNLYTVSSQPPSSGKSGVHNYFTAPIRERFKAVNEGLKKERRQVSVQIKTKEKGAKSAVGMEQASIEMDIEDLQEELKRMGDITYSTDDTTPEALESMAGRQGNFFNVLSPEADVLNILLGGSYGGDAKKVNHGLILKAWDGEYFSSARVTRETVGGHYRGCLGVLAQDAALKALLDAGEGGRGISERVLIMRERPKLGTRDMTVFVPVDQGLKDWYTGLVDNLVGADKTTFTFSDKAKLMVNEYRNDIEVKMDGTGEYSSALFQGVFGKAGAQIYRIACILHAVRDWSVGGKKSIKVKDKTVLDAIAMYNHIADSFVKVSSGQGYAGSQAVLDATIEALKEVAGHGDKKRRTTVTTSGVHYITLARFRDSKRNTKPFNQHRNLSAMLDDVFTVLSEFGVCAYHDKRIYISPNLLQ